MNQTPLIQTLRLRQFLSFGPDTEVLKLQPLNVLIGPNSSGKSNVIEALNLLRATADDLIAPIRAGGGVAEWLWKGDEPQSTATLETTIHYPAGKPLRHHLAFRATGQRFELADEFIDNARFDSPKSSAQFFYRFDNGRPVITASKVTETTGSKNGEQYVKRSLNQHNFNLDQSVLSQRKDPEQYPEITYLGQQYQQIKLYRDWHVGRYAPLRLPQRTDLPQDFLLEDGSNLGLVLNDLLYRSGLEAILLHELQEFHDKFRRISVRVQGGTLQVFLEEKGFSQPIPTTRLSDGTLRYLCLLAILCHPEPPPLIAIEEPELGLHPDILPRLGKLLQEASQRTQLVITTHSNALVDAFSATPEVVIVCEKEAGATVLQRLEKPELDLWLEQYTLGQLWRRGEIGGNRW